mgnify:CR=1 FL=1
MGFDRFSGSESLQDGPGRSETSRTIPLHPTHAFGRGFGPLDTVSEGLGLEFPKSDRQIANQYLSIRSTTVGASREFWLSKYTKIRDITFGFRDVSVAFKNKLT